MYACTECGNLFEAPTCAVDQHGLDSPPYEESEACPVCFESAFIEAFECTECGEYIAGRYIRTEAGLNICDDCYVGRHITEDL